MNIYHVMSFVISGGYFHGINSLTFGVDIQKIRLFGVLQVLVYYRVNASFPDILFNVILVSCFIIFF